MVASWPGASPACRAAGPILRVPGTPGSRLSLRADRTPWIERGLRVITTERPGFGASTRLEGRGFAEHADDTIAILDELGIERLPVYGSSGASPHILAIAARHPDRVAAVTIMVGSAPMDAAEAEQQIDLNALEQRMFDVGDLDEVWRLTEEVRADLLRDPLAAFRAIMASSTAADRAIVEDPGWQLRLRDRCHRGRPPGRRRLVRRGRREHARHGTSISPPSLPMSPGGTATATGTARCPRPSGWSASSRTPACTSGTTRGHLTPYHHEPQILDELLARC